MDIDSLKLLLEQRIADSDTPREVLRAPELRELYARITSLPKEERSAFGQSVNQLKQALETRIAERQSELERVALVPIDVTAPFDANAPLPALLPADQGSTHPLTQEMAYIADIFERMGFVTEDSRELDDQFHMFESLNFPAGHPARDDYDTFMTVETDKNGDPFIAPAHTSTMQYRTLMKYKHNLAQDRPIAAIVPDRVFRNEDVDARHEHTFYQVEGIYVAKGVNVGNLVATLKTFLESYYARELNVRINPFYFPFTEPSFEFALECPFCEDGCNVCSQSKWIELLGCGMIHPNVLRTAGIDSDEYTGFAFGCGIDRLVMMKYQIEDIRHLESGKLAFLRQF